MTPTRYREALAALHWSQRGLAVILGCSDSLTRGWASGRSAIAPEVAAWLERRARAAEADPPPVGFRRALGGRPPRVSLAERYFGGKSP